MYYAVDFYVGQSEQKQSAIIDTGSNMASFPCNKCVGNNCGTHEDQRFFSDKSSTFDIKIDCPTNTFDKNQGGCSFVRRYLEGSSLYGIRVADFITFRNKFKKEGSSMSDYTSSGKKELIMYADFGCTTKETGLFLTQTADGILGLDNGSSFIASVEKEKGSVFSYGFCFHEKGGYMMLETNDPKIPKPLMEGNEHIVLDYTNENEDYNIELNSIRIGDLEIDAGNIRMTIDTGTTFTVLPEELGQSFFKMFDEFCRKHPNDCAKDKELTFKNDLCLQVVAPFTDFKSLDEMLLNFPEIELKFKGSEKAYRMKPKNYFYISQGERERACLSFAKDASFSKVILGGFGIIDHFVYLDRVNKKVVFENDVSCTDQGKRLEEEFTEINEGDKGFLKNLVNGMLGYFVGDDTAKGTIQGKRLEKI